jgi:hypothetical protein
MSDIEPMSDGDEFDNYQDELVNDYEENEEYSSSDEEYEQNQKLFVKPVEVKNKVKEDNTDLYNYDDDEKVDEIVDSDSDDSDSFQLSGSVR